jgi:Tfp pilus assembly protein PilO
MKTSDNNKQVWRKVRVLSLLPIIIFVWMIGWALYWIGDQKLSSGAAQKKTNAQKQHHSL